MSIYATIALLVPYFEDGYTIAISNFKATVCNICEIHVL